MKKITFRQLAMDYFQIVHIPSQDEDVSIDEEMYLKTFLLEDAPDLANERQEVLIEKIKRYKKIVERLKNKYHNQCQICGFTFEKDNGQGYSEAHHIVRLADDGSQNEDNVLILCANHHRMLHYANVKLDVDAENIKGVWINKVYYAIER